MDERKTLKLNIQRTTICILVVLSLLVGVFAVETTAPTISDAVKLSDYSFEVVNNNDGTDTVTTYLPEDPVYQWEIVKPSYASGVHITTGGNFEISTPDYEGQLLLTGYIWPNGKIIDISEIAEDGAFNVNYDCTFKLEVPPYPISSGRVHFSLVPRFRLLRSTGGQIAFVNGESVWGEVDNTDDYGDTLVVRAKGSQEIDLNVENNLPQYPLKYIEIKWQYNIRIENIDGSVGLYLSMYKDSLNFSYDRHHVLTDSELAAKLNDEVGKISDDLAAAGDAFNSVPKPDIDDVMRPVDEIIPQQGMSQLSGAIGMITGTSLVATQFTILGVVLVVSYVLFGKKEAK